MGEEAGITVFVIGVERKVAPRLDLRLGGKAGADDVAAPGKAFGAVGDGLLAERNVEVDLPLDDMLSRTNLINGLSMDATVESIMPWWQIALYAIDVVFVLLMAGSLFMMFRAKRRSEEKA